MTVTTVKHLIKAKIAELEALNEVVSGQEVGIVALNEILAEIKIQTQAIRG